MSGWVEIPVPEALVEQVKRFSTRLSFTAAFPAWDPVTIDAHLRAVAPDVRALVCRVSQRVAHRELPGDEQLADELGVSRRELHGLVQEANDLTIDPFPGPLLWVQAVRTSEPGGTRQDVYMLDRFAWLVCEWIDEHGAEFGVQRRP